MITIYHNPRCRKSREGLALLENSGKEFEVIRYLEDTPSKETIERILKLLNVKPIALIRKNEAIWKAHYKGKALNDEEIVQAMVDHPKLMERPVVIHQDKAVIGRPKERIEDIL
ncbi:arsenate reductase (glutaredoxin) [Maribacter sp. 2307ULW6-5]|uniref:arsenate reductase (glutaredoxin) n=1 Tax=Maribacter sp. 2307ULW6-5 TaxID=3386275 RepID=UPI0039BD9050